MMKRIVVLIALVIWVSGCNRPASPRSMEAASISAPARPVSELMPAAIPTATPARVQTPAHIVAKRAVETPTPPLAPPAPARTHTVRKGDTLWSVAKDFYGSGRRWKEIAAVNGIVDESKLPVGKVLRIP